MIRRALRGAIDEFERDCNDDANHTRDLTDASARAAWQFSRVTAAASGRGAQ